MREDREPSGDHATNTLAQWRDLHAAALGGHSGAIKALLEAGADVNAANTDGWTPLYAAARHGHGEVVRVLLEAGADVNAATTKGWTPLYAAARNGHGEVVRILLKAGADGEVQGVWEPDAVSNIDIWEEEDDEDEDTLHCAAIYNDTESLIALLEDGADVNAKDEDGNTPLHCAVIHKNTEVITMLLSSPDINVDAQNKQQKTPADIATMLAASNSRDEILSRLLIAAAEIETANKENLTRHQVKTIVTECERKELNDARAVPEIVQTTPVVEIASLLKKAAIFKLFAEKLEVRARELLENGEVVPGLSLSEKQYSRRIWAAEAEAVKAMQELGIDPYKIKSPPQAYEALGKKSGVLELDKHITRKYGKRKIDYSD